MTRGRIAAALGIVMACAAAAQAQPPGPPRPPLVIESMAGGDLFRFYCASCHGADARGRGPVAAALRTEPPDLTRLAARNGGAFPRARIQALLTEGSGLPAHGPAEMPVWGPIFRGLDPSEPRTRVRLENLVSYLETLQGK